MKVRVAIVIEPGPTRSSLARRIGNHDGITTVEGEDKEAEIVIASDEPTLRQALEDGRFVIQLICDRTVQVPNVKLQAEFPDRFGCRWIFPNTVQEILRLIDRFRGRDVEVRPHSLHPPIMAIGIDPDRS
jgi:hypothetical protein